MSSLPEYLLFSEADGRQESGDWRFVLQTAEGLTVLEAADREPAVRGDRLELLTLVRGLEALHQPSRVRIVTPSRYVRHGIAFGLDTWRRSGWTWECFGEMAPIKNEDLWRRVDKAFDIHEHVRHAPLRCEARPRRRIVLSTPAEQAARAPLARNGRMLRIDGPHATPAPRERRRSSAAV
jgi:ribonuclease HI